MPDKIVRTRKETFNRIINIRSYEYQPNHENIQSLEQMSHDDKMKKHINLENQFARKLFQSSIYYAKTVVSPNRFKVMVTDEEALKILDTDWSKAECHELISAFRKLSYNVSSDTCRIDETKYNNIFITLNNKIPYFDNDMLEEILKCLIPFSERFEQNLKRTFKLLDIQCERLCLKWSIEKLLLISDIFYCLGIHKDSDFIWKVMRRMNSKLNKLTAKNLIQLLFLVNVTRKSELNMYEVEVRLEQHLDDLSIDELGIAAMGFFKSMTKIRSSIFLRAIISRLICELDKVDTISLAALIKLIRYSMQFNEVVHFRLLLNSIISIVPRLDLMCLVHIAHASARANVYEKALMDVIIERVYNDMQQTRIKDIERLTLALCAFNIDNKHPIYDKIVHEVSARINTDDAAEIKMFPRVLPNLLLYLAIQDIYPLDVIRKAMDVSYVQSMLKRSIYSISTNHSVLHYFLKIERPEYTGPYLEEGLLRTLTKLHWKQSDHKLPNTINKMYNEIVYVLKEYMGSDVNLYIGKLLPHFLQNDIVIGIDKYGNFISAEPILSQLCEFTIKRVDDTFPENVKWIAFVIIHYNHRIKGTNEPIGIIKAKVRQLKRIGYSPILITDDDWSRSMVLEEKGKYLKDLIKNA
ncbi:hypothetical protein KPH14_002407 [Odynerus spinipes]|uniref:RAP domain-containing protein n=1 Tax=Odynerus spinipes TaxID=1348599 RepID=A0AAD9RLM4_9HYME|nr:hypothetical protein KPH14_002407 [Odynerus spinipes]